MPLLVNCTGCQTPLQLPPGANSIRCVLCGAVSHIAASRGSAPPQGYQQHHYQPSAPPASAASPQRYSPAPPPSHGRKKAVICGISYKYSRHELKGCLNDANCMKYLLINKFKFPEASILMLNGKPFIPVLPFLKAYSDRMLIYM